MAVVLLLVSGGSDLSQANILVKLKSDSGRELVMHQTILRQMDTAVRLRSPAADHLMTSGYLDGSFFGGRLHLVVGHYRVHAGAGSLLPGDRRNGIPGESRLLALSPSLSHSSPMGVALAGQTHDRMIMAGVVRVTARRLHPWMAYSQQIRSLVLWCSLRPEAQSLGVMHNSLAAEWQPGRGIFLSCKCRPGLQFSGWQFRRKPPELWLAPTEGAERFRGGRMQWTHRFYRWRVGLVREFLQASRVPVLKAEQFSRNDLTQWSQRTALSIQTRLANRVKIRLRVTWNQYRALSLDVSQQFTSLHWRIRGRFSRIGRRFLSWETGLRGTVIQLLSSLGAVRTSPGSGLKLPGDWSGFWMQPGSTGIRLQQRLQYRHHQFTLLITASTIAMENPDPAPAPVNRKADLRIGMSWQLP